MQLGFFTMPIHPLAKDWRQSLREDREAFMLADELGFVEGYCGEHVTDRAENITSCAMFLSTLVDAVKTMKLGTGTINMPNAHPAAVASQIAMLDHLLDGRFIFGISPAARARATTASSSAAKSGKSRWQWLSTSMVRTSAFASWAASRRAWDRLRPPARSSAERPASEPAACGRRRSGH